MREQQIIKEVAHGDGAKSKIINGVNKIADIVSSTMGYRGNLVLSETEGGMPFVSADGYNILQSILLEDPLEQMANMLLKQASQKTVDYAHDGTTATIVLAQAFVKYSNEEMQKGVSRIDIANNIDASVAKILEYLKEKSIELDKELVFSVAKTSAHGDESIASLIAEAFEKAGENGVVTHFRSETDESFLDYKEGTLVESGYSDESFVNIHSDRTVLFENNPLVVVSHINFKTAQQLKPFLEFAAQNARQIVFVSEMEFQIQNMLLANKIAGKLEVVVIPPPSFGQKRRDFLNDLAMVCGTNAITTLSGDIFFNRETEFLGTCKSVLVGKSDSIFIPKDELDRAPLTGKIEELKAQSLASDNNYEKKYIAERISKLSGGVSIIKVGGIVESEINERLDRFEDAIGAVRSAKEEGCVAGGGVLLYNASLDLKLDSVTSKAIMAPINKIMSNAGKELKLSGSAKYPLGYDVQNYREGDMFELGIVDVAKVVRNALVNAASVANTISRIDYSLTNKRDNGSK
ncbi:MAG: hypothetical protein KBC56_04760 [Flavobacterium sp.]|nr:hypothetical protein [Flavobacterium sp.]